MMRVLIKSVFLLILLGIVAPLAFSQGSWTNKGTPPIPPYTRSWEYRPPYDSTDQGILFYLSDNNCCSGTFSNAMYIYKVGANTWTKLWTHGTTGTSAFEGVPISSISCSGSTVTINTSKQSSVRVGDVGGIKGVTDATNFPNSYVKVVGVGTNTLTYTRTCSASSSGGNFYGPMDAIDAPVDTHPYGIFVYDTTRGHVDTGDGSAYVASNGSPGLGVANFAFGDGGNNNFYEGTISGGSSISWQQICGELNSAAANATGNTNTNAAYCPTGNLQEGAAAYDATNDVVVVYGGLLGGTAHANTWYYHPSTHTWTEPCGENISKHCASPALYREGLVDDGNGNIYMFAGQTTTALYNGLWKLNVSAGTWSQLTPSGSTPAPQVFPIIDWVPRLGALINVDQNQAGAVVWQYNPTANVWTNPTITGTVPILSSQAAGNAGAYDVNADRFVVSIIPTSGSASVWSLKLPAGGGSTRQD